MGNANSIKKLSGGPMRSNVPGLFTLVIEMEIAGTSITSTVPTNAGQITVAHDGTTGDYTITFAEDLKPRRVICGIFVIEEDLPLEKGLWTGYTAATGVGTFTTYDVNDTTQTDFTGTAQLVLFCSDSTLADA